MGMFATVACFYHAGGCASFFCVCGCLHFPAFVLFLLLVVCSAVVVVVVVVIVVEVEVAVVVVLVCCASY